MIRNSLALGIAMLLAVGSFWLSPERAAGGHFTNWLQIRAPFAGYWDRHGLAGPSYHHTPWGGNWATDYYQWPGAIGGFRIVNSNGGTAYGIAFKGSSCAGTTWAGWRYRFDSYDGGGYRGWYLTAHVADTDGLGQSYQLSNNQVVYNGALIGWTGNWGWSTCYQVSSLNDVHWHIEMYQPPTHYSCWVPWSTGAYLTTSNALGAVGSNATSKTSCW